MQCHQIASPKGSRKRRWIVGRGKGSGSGKTSGRGHKGMKARSGGGHRPGFEGGQMPLYRRLPHRGFKNVNRIEYAVINLRDIEDFKGKTIDLASLKAERIIRKNVELLKILGTGEITRAVTVSAHRFSESAKKKIEAAGGKVVELAVAAAE